MIIWGDGHETHYLAPVLRGMCPCASCKDEMTGVRIILPIHIPDDLHFRKIELVGQYALQFEWSDGHRTGIYSFEYLWGGEYIGVMADEVEGIIPEAVITLPSGYKMVDYSMLR